MRAGDKMAVIFRALSAGWGWTVFRVAKRVADSKSLFNMKSEVDPGGAVGYLKVCQRLGELRFAVQSVKANRGQACQFLAFGGLDSALFASRCVRATWRVV